MSGIHPRLLSVHRGVLHCPSSYCIYRAQQIEAIRLPTSTVCLLRWLTCLLTYLLNHNTITVPPTRYQYNIHRVQYCLLQMREREEKKKAKKSKREMWHLNIHSTTILIANRIFPHILSSFSFPPRHEQQQTENPQSPKHRIKLRR